MYGRHNHPFEVFQQCFRGKRAEKYSRRGPSKKCSRVERKI